MKNIYFLVAAFVLIFQSCTIQKRQHLPGYHIEWKTNDAYSELQNLKSEDNEVIPDIVNTAVVEEIAPTQVVSAEKIQDDAIASAVVVNSNQETTTRSQIKQQDPGKVRRLTFPSIIHSPAKMLFGGLHPEDKPRTDGMSIAAMVCGIVGVLIPGTGIILSILAIIFGAIGMGRTSRNTELKGKGMAITGLVLGILGLLVTVLVLAVLSSYWWY
jgi:hypothetical protein